MTNRVRVAFSGDPIGEDALRSALARKGLAVQLVSNSSARQQAPGADLLVVDLARDARRRIERVAKRNDVACVLFVGGSLEGALREQAEGLGHHVADLDAGTASLAAEWVSQSARGQPVKAVDESLLGHLDELLWSSPDAIVTVDREGTILLFNHAAETLFACTAEDALGKLIDIFLPSESRSEHRGSDPQELRPARRQVVGKRLSGEHFPAEVATSRMTIDRASFVTTIVRDISNRHVLEAQLMQAQKLEAVGRLAAGVAHDFNNLLSTMQCSIYLAKLSKGISDSLATELQEIDSAAQRGAALTRQLLGFAGRKAGLVQPIDLTVAVSQMRGLIERLIGEHLVFETAFEVGAGVILADPSRIEQATMNLVVNARDAMPRGGTLRIETLQTTTTAPLATVTGTMPPGRYTRLRVVDTGQGMSTEVMQHIFEPFFTTKAIGRGTGLGLSTVVDVVREHGAFLMVESHLGEGTCFDLYFPTIEEDATDDDSSPVETPSLRAANEAIAVLLVEDDEPLRRATARILRQRGYRVEEAPSGADGLEIASRLGAGLSLLLTDVVLPSISGRDLATRIRTDCPNAQVLFMSGYGRAELEEHGIDPSAHPFLTKPYTIVGLLNAITDVLSTKP